MTKTELAYLIGEFLSAEVEDVAKVSYEAETEQAVSFIVKMENGKKFNIKIAEKE